MLIADIIALAKRPTENLNFNSKDEDDTTKKLLDLKKLYDEGIISEEEYNEKRNKLVS